MLVGGEPAQVRVRRRVVSHVGADPAGLAGGARHRGGEVPVRRVERVGDRADLVHEPAARLVHVDLLEADDVRVEVGDGTA